VERPEPCPDCNSEIEWTQIGGTWMWCLGHDETCPTWGAKARRIGMEKEDLLMGTLGTVEEL
jgi:hypothetical protein